MTGQAYPDPRGNLTKNFVYFFFAFFWWKANFARLQFYSPGFGSDQRLGAGQRPRSDQDFWAPQKCLTSNCLTRVAGLTLAQPRAWPGPAQGLTQASSGQFLGQDFGQTEQQKQQHSLQQQRGARAKRARPLLGGGRRPPPLFAKKQFFDQFFGLG